MCHASLQESSHLNVSLPMNLSSEISPLSTLKNLGTPVSDSFHFLFYTLILNGFNKHLFFLQLSILSVQNIIYILSPSPMHFNRNRNSRLFMKKFVKNLTRISLITSGLLKRFMLPYPFFKLETLTANITSFFTSHMKNNQSPNTG